MKEINILFFYRGPEGGVGKVIPLLGEVVGRSDCRVYLASVQSVNKDYRDQKFQFYSFNKKKLVASLPSLIYLLIAKRIHLIFCASTFPSVAGYFATKLVPFPIKVVASVRTNLSFTLSAHPPFKKAFLKWVAKAVLRRTPNIVAVSSGVKEDLTKNFGVNPSSIRVIYPPALENNIIEKSKDDPGHEWFKDPNLSVVLSVGRLSRQKDYITLIRAFGTLLKFRSDVRLIIVGDGPERIRVESEIKSMGLANFVFLTGHQDNPYKFYVHSDLFVLTSRWGGLDNVLVEAIYFDLPIVCTDFPYGPRELMEMGFLDKLAPVGDFKTIGLQMKEGLEQPAKRGKIGNLENMFSLDSVARKHEDFFQEVLRNSGKKVSKKKS